jgi:hypothetical protein
MFLSYLTYDTSVRLSSGRKLWFVTMFKTVGYAQVVENGLSCIILLHPSREFSTDPFPASGVPRTQKVQDK